MLFERSPTPRGIATVAVLLVILVITLIPAGSGPPMPVSFALGVGRRWLADGILNLCLFVPLGLVLGWDSRSPVKAVCFGLLLSTTTEIAQIWIPGRDPSLSDIIFNTAGTAIGALIGLRPRAWLFPPARSSVALTGVGVVVATLVMTITGLLLSPASPNDRFAATRAGNDLMLEYRSRADAAGFDQPVYWLAHAFSDTSKGDPPSVSVQRERTRWYVSAAGRRATLGPTVGEGWTLLAYPDAIVRQWGGTLDVVWVFLLCVPIGFWARTGPSLAVAGVIALVLLWLPDVVGIVSTPLPEWIGAAIGFLVGASVGWLSRQAPGIPGEVASLSARRR